MRRAKKNKGMKYLNQVKNSFFKRMRRASFDNGNVQSKEIEENNGPILFGNDCLPILSLEQSKNLALYGILSLT